VLLRSATHHKIHENHEAFTTFAGIHVLFRHASLAMGRVPLALSADFSTPFTSKILGIAVALERHHL
jgi:hypothetical protein